MASLQGFATSDYVHEEGERTHRHFDVVADGLKEAIKVIAEDTRRSTPASRTSIVTSRRCSATTRAESRDWKPARRKGARCSADDGCRSRSFYHLAHIVQRVDAPAKIDQPIDLRWRHRENTL